MNIYSAEFMLDVIGAGATAKSTQDWHTVWRESCEFEEMQRQIADIHTMGRIHPPVQAAYTPTSWLYQMHVLLHRNTIAFWRDPTYIMSKMVLNAIGGLFIGVTFYHSADSQQGTLNKIFVRPASPAFITFMTLTYFRLCSSLLYSVFRWAARYKCNSLTCEACMRSGSGRVRCTTGARWSPHRF